MAVMNPVIREQLFRRRRRRVIINLVSIFYMGYSWRVNGGGSVWN